MGLANCNKLVTRHPLTGLSDDGLMQAGLRRYPLLLDYPSKMSRCVYGAALIRCLFYVFTHTTNGQPSFLG